MVDKNFKNEFLGVVKIDRPRLEKSIDDRYGPPASRILDLVAVKIVLYWHVGGALFTLRIQYEYTQTQCEEGARYVIFVLFGNITHMQHIKMCIIIFWICPRVNLFMWVFLSSVTAKTKFWQKKSWWVFLRIYIRVLSLIKRVFWPLLKSDSCLKSRISRSKVVTSHESF